MVQVTHWSDGTSAPKCSELSVRQRLCESGQDGFLSDAIRRIHSRRSSEGLPLRWHILTIEAQVLNDIVSESCFHQCRRERNLEQIQVFRTYCPLARAPGIVSDIPFKNRRRRLARQYDPLWSRQTWARISAAECITVSSTTTNVIDSRRSRYPVRQNPTHGYPTRQPAARAIGFGFDRLQFLDHRFLHGTRCSHPASVQAPTRPRPRCRSLGEFAVNLSRSHFSD